MGQTLSQMISLAETLRRNAAKDELYPSEDWQQSTKDGMSLDQHLSYLSPEALLDVQPQVYPEHDLRGQDEHQQVRELGVGVRSELSSLVGVSDEVSHDCDDCGSDLYRDVPSGAHQPEDHARREHDPPRERLDEYMYP
jgi:hypothetical protein